MGGDVTDEAFLEVASRAVHMAKSNYLAEFPNLSHLAEDLEAIGLMAATEVLRKRDLTTIDNLDAYLYTSAIHAMGDGVAKEDAIAGQTKVDGLNREFVEITREAPDYTGEVDLLDEIYACCHDQTDRRIVDLRAVGNTDEEVAAELGLSRNWITIRRLRIEERFNARS